MARTILEHNDRNEPIWYGKLAEVLEDRLDPHQVSYALDCDRDCGIVTPKWENTDGQWSYNLYLRDECAA